MHREKLSAKATSAIVFILVAAVLGCVIWLGWSLVHRHYSLPTIDNLQSNVKVSVGVVGSPQSLDIRTQDDTSLDQALIGNVYETLIGTDENNELTPSIASRWNVSDDGLTYTFSIRQARFANGHTLNAADVAWSLKRIIEKHYIGADQLNAIASVTASNSTKLTITLNEPDQRLLRALSGRAGIVYDSQANIDYATQAAGSGPFRVTEWVPNQRIVLERNADYWGSKAKAETITIMYHANDADLANALNTGDIDAAVAMNKTSADAVTAENIVRKQGSSTRKIVLGFNNDASSILSDKRYRQAVRYLVDRASMTEALGGGETLSGPLASLDADSPSDQSSDHTAENHTADTAEPESSENADNTPSTGDTTSTDNPANTGNPFPYDPDKGNELIAYFRFRNSRRPLTFVYPQRYGDAPGKLLAQALSNEPANVDLNIQMVDDATWKQTVNAHQYDFTLYEVDDEDYLDTLMDPQSFISFVSPDSQQAWNTVLQSTNKEDYANNFAAFTAQLNDDSPVDWICALQPITMYTNSVTGLPVNMTYTRMPLATVTSAH